jgi:acetyl esterase/lipase
LFPLLIAVIGAGPMCKARDAEPKAAPAGAAPGAAAAPVVLPLWSAGAPGSESRRQLPETRVDNNIAGIHDPSLTIFPAEPGTATGTGVVVIPGGGHRFVVVEKEGYTVARWLAGHGISAFVLKYRLAREAGSTYRIDVEELQDVQRAIRTVRSRAASWRVDPTRVGVLGFSAGGELAALASMRSDVGHAESDDPIERQSSRPAFQGLVYPGASQNIAPDKEAPPAFLVSGYDDRPDVADGVARAYLAFRAVAVPAELHVYTGVGHGFALRPGPASGWVDRFAAWIAERTAVPAPAAPLGTAAR